MGTDVAALEIAPPNSPIGYCVLWLLSHLSISHLHSYLVACTVHIIIIMYLDPSVSINSKYKTLNNIRLDPSTNNFLIFLKNSCMKIIWIKLNICKSTKFPKSLWNFDHDAFVFKTWWLKSIVIGHLSDRARSVLLLSFCPFLHLTTKSPCQPGN